MSGKYARECNYWNNHLLPLFTYFCLLGFIYQTEPSSVAYFMLRVIMLFYLSPNSMWIKAPQLCFHIASRYANKAPWLPPAKHCHLVSSALRGHYSRGYKWAPLCDSVVASYTISHVLKRTAITQLLQDTGAPLINTFLMLCPVDCPIWWVLWPYITDPFQSWPFCLLYPSLMLYLLLYPSLYQLPEQTQTFPLLWSLAITFSNLLSANLAVS